MKTFKMYAQYVFLVALFLSNIPLMCSNASYGQDSIVVEDNGDGSMTATSAEPTIAWYRRPIVKNIAIGGVIVAMGGYIVWQKIVINIQKQTIDQLIDIAREANSI